MDITDLCPSHSGLVGELSADGRESMDPPTFSADHSLSDQSLYSRSSAVSGGLSNTFNSREFFLAHHPRLFIGSSILVVISLVHNILYLGLPITEQIPQALVLTILLVVLLVKNKNSIVHTFVSIILLLIMIIGFALDQENLVIR
jgi:hypothetical protein